MSRYLPSALMGWCFLILGTVALLRSDYVGAVAGVLGFVAACINARTMHLMARRISDKDRVIRAQYDTIAAMRISRQL